MLKIYSIVKQLLFPAIITGGLISMTGCSSHDGHDEHDDHEDHASESEAAEKSHDEEKSLMLIHLSDEDARLLGVVTESVQPKEFRSSLAVNGDILSTTSGSSLVVAPTSGTLVIPEGIIEGAHVNSGAVIANIDPSKVSGSDIETVNAATLRSAREEYQRMNSLREKGLVTASQLNSAREAFEKAQALVNKSGVSRRAVSPFSGTITSMLVTNGAFVQAGDPIASVAKSTRLSLKANVADRHAGFISQITGAKIQLPGEQRVVDLSEYNLSSLSAGTNGMSEGGYIPVMFSFDNPGVTSGRTSALVYLLGAPRSGVLTVPVEAISEDQGVDFVFKSTSPEHYVKTPVRTGQTDGQYIEIISGLNPGDMIVVKGAPMVRMAQSMAQPVHGHSHNH